MLCVSVNRHCPNSVLMKKKNRPPLPPGQRPVLNSSCRASAQMVEIAGTPRADLFQFPKVDA